MTPQGAISLVAISDTWLEVSMTPLGAEAGKPREGCFHDAREGQLNPFHISMTPLGQTVSELFSMTPLGGNSGLSLTQCLPLP